MTTITLPNQPTTALTLTETSQAIEARIIPLITHHNHIIAALSSTPNATYTSQNISTEFNKLLSDITKAQAALDKAYLSIGAYQIKHHLI